ncbi:MerR family transcriptional regulator [Melioribacter sp. OK-6-Me]|uniref:MerR family transcriptional regulator n=1 Tax=unclassified Melioribacter TaxID=2627329 RepID=UPI003EDAA61E
MIEQIDRYEPIFPIGTAAKIIGISVHTLRMYEREGLIIPYKKESKQRLFSKADIERIECIRKAINDSKISINGIKSIYSLIPCWEIVNCSEEDRQNCKSYKSHGEPCWNITHPRTMCAEKDCRKCDVYNKYTQCGEIKELIKSISR